MLGCVERRESGLGNCLQVYPDGLGLTPWYGPSSAVQQLGYAVIHGPIDTASRTFMGALGGSQQKYQAGAAAAGIGETTAGPVVGTRAWHVAGLPVAVEDGLGTGLAAVGALPGGSSGPCEGMGAFQRFIRI